MGIGDNIIVNDFMFCRDHGEEYCYRCFCDHRYTNNYANDELDDLYLDYEFVADHRASFNAYDNGAVPAQKSSDKFECVNHHTIDCGVCFNWIATIINEAKEKKKESDRLNNWLEKRKKWLDKVDP